MAPKISTTGIWQDLQTGRLVDARPSEGIQLTAPGEPISYRVAAIVERVGIGGSLTVTDADPQEAADVETATLDGPPESAVEPDAVGDATTKADEIRHVGGGWYELPNGERVHGKDAAEAAVAQAEAG